jgi:hypothetical protein
MTVAYELGYSGQPLNIEINPILFPERETNPELQAIKDEYQKGLIGFVEKNHIPANMIVPYRPAYAVIQDLEGIRKLSHADTIKVSLATQERYSTFNMGLGLKEPPYPTPENFKLTGGRSLEYHMRHFPIWKLGFVIGLTRETEARFDEETIKRLPYGDFPLGQYIEFMKGFRNEKRTPEPVLPQRILEKRRKGKNVTNVEHSNWERDQEFYILGQYYFSMRLV